MKQWYALYVSLYSYQLVYLGVARRKDDGSVALVYDWRGYVFFLRPPKDEPMRLELDDNEMFQVGFRPQHRSWRVFILTMTENAC